MKQIPVKYEVYSNGRTGTGVVMIDEIDATHMCGLSGFGHIDDVCPRCQAERQAAELARKQTEDDAQIS